MVFQYSGAAQENNRQIRLAYLSYQLVEHKQFKLYHVKKSACQVSQE